MTGPMGRNQIVRLILRQAEAPRPSLWQQVAMWWAAVINKQARA